MIPNPMVVPSMRRRNDTNSIELRRYARDEWHSEFPWTPTRDASPTVLSRFRRWLRRSRQKELRKPSPAPDAPAAGSAARVASDPDCPHSAQETLGLGGGTAFLRCRLCGEVLVVHGGRVWGLPPSLEAEGRSPEDAELRDQVAPFAAQ